MNRIIVENDTMRFYSQAQKIPIGQSMFSVIEFTFSEEWKNFTKIAQFKQYSNAYNVEITDDQCYVPSELLVGKCSLRIRGYSKDQQDVIATANELILTCVQGFESGGVPPVPPTPDLYQKLADNFGKKVGDLSDLSTKDKTNLVAAINEATQKPASFECTLEYDSEQDKFRIAGYTNKQLKEIHETEYSYDFPVYLAFYSGMLIGVDYSTGNGFPDAIMTLLTSGNLPTSLKFSMYVVDLDSLDDSSGSPVYKKARTIEVPATIT